MTKTLKENKIKMGGLGLEVTTVNKIGRDTAEVGVGVIMVLAALIGIWGIACLFGGIVQGGGIAELVNGFISAVTGV